MTEQHIRSGVPLCASTALLLCFVLFGVLLSGCAPIERQQARVRAFWAELTGTASGAVAVTRETVEGTIEAGRAAAGSVQQTVQDLQDRAAKVQEGAKKIQEGKKLIEKGVGN